MIGTSIRNENLSNPSFSSGLPAEEPALLDRAQQFYSNLTFNSDASFNPAGAYIQTASETVRGLFVGKVERDGAAVASAYRRWSGVSENRVLSVAAGLLGVNVSIWDSLSLEPTRNLLEGLVYGTAGMLNEKAPVENRWESGAAVLGVVSSLVMGASGVMGMRGAVRPQALSVKAEVVRSTKVIDVSLNPATGSYGVNMLPAGFGESVGTALTKPTIPAPRPLVVIPNHQLAFVGGGASPFYRNPFTGGGAGSIFNRGLVHAPEGKGSGPVSVTPASSSAPDQIAKHIADLRNPNLPDLELWDAASALGEIGGMDAIPALTKL